MDLTTENLVGSKVEILTYDRNGLKKDKIYVSQFEQQLEDKLFKIATPIHEGKIVPMHIDQKVRIVYYTKKGIYAFDAVILQRESGLIPLLTIQKISEVKKVQRREYFRYDCILPFEYKLITDPQRYEGLIKNISGGGICFITNHKFDGKSLIACFMNLEGDQFDCVGEVLRIMPSDNASYRYEVNVKFSKITDVNREKIVKYIFEEQRRIQKKQKGLI